jgi:hypothetical protein
MTIAFSLLLFFLFVRFVLPRVLRAVLSGFVRQQVHKAQQGGFYPPAGAGPTGSYQAQSQPEPATRSGQVRVEYVPPTTSASERKHEFRGGEYVDYEEIK